MDATKIIDESMTLEQKLSAIEQAMQNAQEQAKEDARLKGQEYVPIDPSQLTICDGCE